MVGMRSKKDEEEKKADTLGGCDDREVFADDPVDLDPSPNNKDDDNDKGHVDTTSEKKGAIDDKATAKDDARNAPVVNGVDTNDDGKDVVGDEDGDNEDDDSEDDDVEMDGWNASKGAVDVPTVGWWRQFVVCVWYKNTSLLQRKPIHLAVLLLSGVAAVLTAWPAGRDYTASEAIYPQTLTTCGTIPHEFFDTFNRSSDTFYDDVSKVKLSLNEPWRNGLPVAVLSLGPLLFAIFAFLIVHDELQLQMLGILRGLGLRDSVYWVSWYVPFAVLAFINSVLAAATAKLIPVHVFEATYYAGIMGAFFFLQLALLGASFFLAAVTGIRKRGAIWWILLMMIPLWIPFFVMNFNFYGLSAYEVSGSSYSTTPHGLFWMNRVTNVNLVSYNFNDDFYNNDGSFSDDETSSNQTNSFNGTNIFNGDARGPEQTSTRCNIPLLSEEEGNKFKTDDERLKVTPDQFFLGCFFSAGFGSSSWAPVGKTNAGLAVWWFIPYFHFNTIWGNFCGLTGNPSTEFTVKHAGLSAGQLARAGLPAPLTDTNSSGTTLFPQGSMLQETIPDSYVCETYGVEGYCEIFKSNCPAENLSSGNFNFCTDTGASSCTVATSSPADGISVNAMFVMLLALSIVYVFMAAYWGIAFVGGAGTHPFYFIFMRNYWLGVDTRRQSPGRVGELDSEVGRNGSASQRNAAVQIHGVSKSYGSVDALKPVSFEMALGEVTALLGHNGAGKFLSSIRLFFLLTIVLSVANQYIAIANSAGKTSKFIWIANVDTIIPI